jgi:hypothetical protein
VIVSFVAVSVYLRLEPLKVALIFMHIIVIFLLNDVLFEPSYWGDQNRYLSVTKSIRNVIVGTLLSIDELISPEGIFSVGDALRVLLPSYIFAFSPIPFINSVQSIAMINFLLYLLSFFYLKKKRISSNSVDFFFLLYPSFLLYSSLALRETLTTLFMILSLYFLIVEEKKLTAFIFMLPLAIIKIQNFLILILAYVVHSFLRNGSIQRYLILIGVGLLVIFLGDHVPLINFFFEKIDYYRYNLIAENFGYNWDFMSDYNYQPFTVGFPMILLVLKSFVYMLFKPFPWEATNLVQLIQSVENIVIAGLILWILGKRAKTSVIKKKLLFLNILLILSMTIYGLVTFNFGTAARFRFPFIVVYLVFYLYLLKSDKIISRQFFRGYSSTPAI